DCYLFRIFDSAGNGICCNYGEGHYYIKVGGEKIIEGAGDFGSMAYHSFKLVKKPDMVGDNAAASFNIYPNPANNMLYVEGEDIEIVEIYNSLGQRVLAVEGVAEKTSIDVASFDNGVYVVRVVGSNGISTKKVSILR
ncbi:MAG: T9SS type A sorting domain-containing protein, partial [Bacteroidales bacterium]|nr:T9SS type A sorting domain-containing protein [Bacteroidales bacterium]